MRLLAQLPPGSWAVAMACGIVSIDMNTLGQPVLSVALFAFAAAVWLVLAFRFIRFPDLAVRESTAPPILSSIAATTVLGSRFAAAGVHVVSVVLLVLAATALITLAWPVLSHWVTPTTGTSFLLAVATQGVAVLSATLAASYRLGWLLAIAMVLSLAGLAGYVFVVWRFNPRALATGMGDHWVAGGALAISALAAGKIAAAALVIGTFAPWRDALDAAALAVWCVAMIWFAPLVLSEFIWPRFHYHALRWATVFPVGMYSACSFAVGKVTGIGGITTFATIWAWVALAVTTIVLIGLGRRSCTVLREQHTAPVELAAARVGTTAWESCCRWDNNVGDLL